MANPDSACFVWKVARGQYRSLVETIWGNQSFAINWPGDIASVCARPAPPPANNAHPVHLDEHDRGISNSTFDHITMSIAAYEASPEVSPFSSKFDAWLAGNAQLTPEEQHGYELFRNRGRFG
jgi:cytochrome c peroxidase